MATETQTVQQGSVSARALAHIQRRPEWKNLNWSTREALRLKITTTDGDLIKALAILAPRDSYENHAALAREILSHPHVAALERALDLFSEQIERENSAKESKS
jgi:hypothetical protein